MATPGSKSSARRADGRAALRMAVELRPDVAVLDLSMPGMNGVDVTRQLLRECPACKVIVLTVHEDRSYFRKLIEVGAVGYVLKCSVSEDLLRAIHSVAAGGIYTLIRRLPERRSRGSRTRPGSIGPLGRSERTRTQNPAPGRARPQQQGDRRPAQSQREERRDLQGARHGQARFPQPRATGGLCRRRGMAEGGLSLCARGLIPCGLRRRQGNSPGEASVFPRRRKGFRKRGLTGADAAGIVTLPTGNVRRLAWNQR